MYTEDLDCIFIAAVFVIIKQNKPPSPNNPNVYWRKNGHYDFLTMYYLIHSKNDWITVICNIYKSMLNEKSNNRLYILTPLLKNLKQVRLSNICVGIPRNDYWRKKWQFWPPPKMFSLWRWLSITKIELNKAYITAIAKARKMSLFFQIFPSKLGLLALACSLSYLGSRGRKVYWVWKFKASMDNTEKSHCM
jgi:hypothetical protein